MAKTSGLGWTTCSVDDASGTPVVIKNDVTSLQFATPRAVQDVTGIDKSANERLLLLADASITLETVFNPSGAHTVFSTVSSTSVARTTTLVVSAKTLAMEILYTDYPFQRSATGEATISVPGVLADGTVPTWS
jgi:hypothetical protein